MTQFDQHQRASCTRVVRAAFGGWPRLLQRARDLGRHVFLVVLGQHLIGDEGAVGIEPPVRHHAGALAKQIRQHLVVAHRHAVAEIGDHEAAPRAMPGVRSRLPFSHHAAESEALARLDLAGGDHARIEVEHDVLLEGAQRQRRSPSPTPARIPSTQKSRRRRGVMRLRA